MEKRLKILVGTNCLTDIQYPAYTNHCQFWFRLGRSYPDIDFVAAQPPRMSIDRMRNMCAEQALALECDYILFLDDDVLIPMDALQKLLNCNADIASGKMVIRGYPFNWMLFKGTDDDPNGMYACTELPESGIEPVSAVGFSLTLIKVGVFRDMMRPYFVTGVSNTEDIYFCVKARRINPDVTIVCECSLNCGHILWPEVMNNENREVYKEYYEKMNPSLLVAAQSGDRGSEYLVEVEKTLLQEEVIRG